MKRLYMLLLLFLFLLPVSAQISETTQGVFLPLDVDTLRLRLSEENGAALIFNAAPTVCQDLLVDVRVDETFIDVDAYVPRDASPCTTDEPYEPIINLPDLATDQTYILLLNDVATRFYLPNPDSSTSDMPFTAAWNADTPLINFTIIESFINTVLFADDDGNLSLRLSGFHPDTCETDIFTWVRPSRVQANLYHIEVYRLLPQGVTCNDSLNAFQQTITTELPINVEDVFLSIGEETYYVDNLSAEIVIQNPISTEEVTITENGDAFSVNILSNIRPDCGLEPDIHVYEDDFFSEISILSYQPQASDCSPEPRRHETTVTVQTLPVIINGLGYDENGILPPPSRNFTAAGADNNNNSDNETPSEGNNMRVETVIENVEVAVLESFPMQLQLTVSGYQPDGCEVPVQTEQNAEGDTVTVTIYREIPVDTMCPAILNPYEATITLDETFTGGTVNIQVNDFSTSVTLD